MLHIIATNENIDQAYARFAERRGIYKSLSQLDLPNGTDPIKYANRRRATATKAFCFELRGNHLEAFKRVHSTSHRRAYIIII